LFSSRRRHTRCYRDWSSDVCSSDLGGLGARTAFDLPPFFSHVCYVGNTFGHLFRITTWGESHGGGVGVVVDGCPPRLELSEADKIGRASCRERGERPGGSGRRDERK